MKVYIEADSIATEKMSGIGHATLEITRALDKLIQTNRELSVTVIVPYKTKHYINAYNFKNIKVKSLPWGQKYVNYLLARTSLPVPIDLLYGRGVYLFPNYKTWSVPFSKSITFAHDVVFKKYPDTLNPKNLVYLEANFERWMNKTDAIISISESSAKEFKMFFPQFKDKVHVIYLGVDPEVYYPKPKDDITSVRNKYEIPENYFLYVGNLEPRKNIDRLLDGYKIYSDQTNRAKSLVLIGGDGWSNDSIKKKINDLTKTGYKIVRPKAYVADDNLPALYSGAHANIHVAIHEGFGLPPIQAQACGTPVVASDIPPLKEVLDSNNTIFVDPYNPEEIAKALEEPRSRRLATGSKFTWDSTTLHIMQLIDKIK